MRALPPARRGRSVALSAAAAPNAPSTCIHSPRSAQASAIAASGSIAPTLTEPAVATTKNGVRPAAASASTASRSASTSIVKSAPTGTMRSWSEPRPRMSKARFTHECVPAAA